MFTLVRFILKELTLTVESKVSSFKTHLNEVNGLRQLGFNPIEQDTYICCNYNLSKVVTLRNFSCNLELNEKLYKLAPISNVLVSSMCNAK